MMYGKFAYLYDQLMKDVPYEKWLQLIQMIFSKYGGKREKFLDLACGTGELSVRLAASGFEVTGVDLSSDMLAIAQEKASHYQQKLLFFEKNMTDLDGLGIFDAVGIFCDSLNYLESENDVKKTFQAVYKHLTAGGLFLFDVHSIYKMNTQFSHQTFAYNGEEISYIWQCFQGDYENSVEHELSFFSLDHKTKQYQRFDELHKQRTFPINVYRRWLQAAGFTVLQIIGDFDDAAALETAERIFFVAGKS
ncbi:class I SAM-dependent methyltransferase [Bacillaceae bacterium Marseille-Q3522]|nr:class I SAM-dependent methyltransferase [Bacillaceae bacterium Marseille-Q3522]